jgi:uncharacterized FlgJ-related protein
MQTKYIFRSYVKPLVVEVIVCILNKKKWLIKRETTSQIWSAAKWEFKGHLLDFFLLRQRQIISINLPAFAPSFYSNALH